MQRTVRNDGKLRRGPYRQMIYGVEVLPSVKISGDASDCKRIKIEPSSEFLRKPVLPADELRGRVASLIESWRLFRVYPGDEFYCAERNRNLLCGFNDPDSGDLRGWDVLRGPGTKIGVRPSRCVRAAGRAGRPIALHNDNGIRRRRPGKLTHANACS